MLGTSRSRVNCSVFPFAVVRIIPVHTLVRPIPSTHLGGPRLEPFTPQHTAWVEVFPPARSAPAALSDQLVQFVKHGAS